ncbi:hypothetical protein OC846_004909 [Tilletia horrida]|uniref:chitin deacetylase n=1 Tax=Tilletia horrida TaxID=155126 RepID=A0AAN6GMA1_9BASI|nr:hypothetical protein OC846_004909 [Tilletia horrida]
MKRQSTSNYPALNGKPLQASDCKPEWKAALEAAVKAGKIPDIPPSTSADGGTPTYPASVKTKEICSWSLDQCQGPNDIHTAPEGWAGINFDDGPTQATPRLNSFLMKNNISATRFLIGGQVVGMPEAFKDILKDPNQQLAVHTYTHHQMTTLSNEQAVAELGWTQQAILDFSGYLPSMWRGPTGDVDNRIRAIAEELFGLRHVSWNYDSDDWCVSQGESVCAGENPGGSAETITAYIDKTFAGPKNPGVILLEHELSDITVGFFEEHAWPGITKNGWKHGNVAQVNGVAWYANAADSKAAKTPVKDILIGKNGGGSASTGTNKPSKNGSGMSGATSSSSSTSSSPSSASTSSSGSTSTTSSTSSSSSGTKTGSASAMAGASTAAVLGLMLTGAGFAMLA